MAGRGGVLLYIQEILHPIACSVDLEFELVGIKVNRNKNLYLYLAYRKPPEIGDRY